MTVAVAAARTGGAGDKVRGAVRGACGISSGSRPECSSGISRRTATASACKPAEAAIMTGLRPAGEGTRLCSNIGHLQPH